MEHKPVRSSMIHTVGYDPEQQKMEVTFKNGQTYEYHGIKPVTHAMFVNAKSVGSHLTKHITPHHKFNKKTEKI